MRLSERLVKQNEENRQKNKAYLEDEEETMTYMDRKMSKPLNTEFNSFSKDDQSLNKQASIFNRTALFHTDGKKENQG